MNIKLFEYALLSLARRKWRHIFIFTVFTLLSGTALSLFTVSGALKREAMFSVNNLPDITVSRYTGGLRQYTGADVAEKIIMLPGVVSAVPRIWGYYPFEYLNADLRIIGVDVFDPALSKTMQEIADSTDIQALRTGGTMIIGPKLDSLIKGIYNKDEFSFQKADGEYITLKTAGVFKTASKFISADTVLTDMKTARAILGIPEGSASDIAVNVANPQEISTVSEKIENLGNGYKALTKETVTASYQNMFDYSGGIFLLFFISAVLTFLMIAAERLSGLSGDETREIAVLKAVGWDTADVLAVKLYESAVVSVTAFLTAFLLSLVYVFVMKAPGLDAVFTGFSHLRPDFDLPFYINPAVPVSVFLLLVPLYAAAVIIPSWRAASADPGEAVR